MNLKGKGENAHTCEPKQLNPIKKKLQFKILIHLISLPLYIYFSTIKYDQGMSITKLKL